MALLAGVELDDHVAAAVTDGSAGAALRAGLRDARDGFTRHMVEQFSAHRDNGLLAYLSAALVLVAEHREDSIIGALVAFPPPNVAAGVLDQTEQKITDPCAREDDEEDDDDDGGRGGPGQGSGRGSGRAGSWPAYRRSLLAFCSKIYRHCGFMFVYGQTAVGARLEDFAVVMASAC
jgi:hypothetical protein